MTDRTIQLCKGILGGIERYESLKAVRGEPKDKEQEMAWKDEALAWSLETNGGKLSDQIITIAESLDRLAGGSFYGRVIGGMALQLEAVGKILRDKHDL